MNQVSAQQSRQLKHFARELRTVANETDTRQVRQAGILGGLAGAYMGYKAGGVGGALAGGYLGHHLQKGDIAEHGAGAGAALGSMIGGRYGLGGALAGGLIGSKLGQMGADWYKKRQAAGQQPAGAQPAQPKANDKAAPAPTTPALPAANTSTPATTSPAPAAASPGAAVMGKEKVKTVSPAKETTEATGSDVLEHVATLILELDSMETEFESHITKFVKAFRHSQLQAASQNNQQLVEELEHVMEYVEKLKNSLQQFNARHIGSQILDEA